MLAAVGKEEEVTMRNEEWNAACDGIEAATRLSMVGITDETQQGIGTGTLVRWRGHHLILTAEHVIAGALSESLRFLLPPDSPPIEVTREILSTLTAVPRKAARASLEIKVGRVVRDPELDLAAIEVESSLEKRYPIRFFDFAEGGRTPVEGQMTIIAGFPWDISRSMNKSERLVFPQSEWTHVESNREIRDFDPAKHFLAHYNWAETYPDAKPHGISGAAMWFRLGTTPVVWHPNLDIAGVAITYYPGVRLMKIVRREAVEEFLTVRVSW